MESTLRNNVGMGGKPPSHPMRAMVKFTRQNPPPGFYTYAYLREDGRPYYIGKGKAKRVWRQHGSPGRYWKPPGDERILFLKWGLTEEEAFAHEIYLISVYGNSRVDGWLSMNFDEGGLGSTGSRHTEEFKAYIRSVHLGKKLSPKQKEAFHKGRASMSQEQRKEAGQRSADARKANGYVASAETRSRMSESMRGKNTYSRTPEMRAAISCTLTGHKQSQSQIEKRREKLIGKKRTPEMKAKYSELAKQREQSPAVKAQRSEQRLRRYAESAQKYGITIEQWAAFPQNVRVMLSSRYGKGKRGAELLAGIAV